MGDTGHLQTQAHELVKQHIVYDGSNRVEYVYTCRSDTIDGAPCSIVRYAYDGVSSRVTFMKEYEGAWDTAWETF